jgi:hypothetical protein
MNGNLERTHIGKTIAQDRGSMDVLLAPWELAARDLRRPAELASAAKELSAL